MSIANWATLVRAIALPQFPGQTFCGAVHLAPGLYVTAYVPTAAEREGDFSAYYPGVQLVDPFSGSPIANDLTPPPPRLAYCWTGARTFLEFFRPGKHLRRTFGKLQPQCRYYSWRGRHDRPAHPGGCAQGGVQFVCGPARFLQTALPRKESRQLCVRKNHQRGELLIFYPAHEYHDHTIHHPGQHFGEFEFTV